MTLAYKVGWKLESQLPSFTCYSSMLYHAHVCMYFKILTQIMLIGRISLYRRGKGNRYSVPFFSDAENPFLTLMQGTSRMLVRALSFQMHRYRAHTSIKNKDDSSQAFISLTTLPWTFHKYLALSLLVRLTSAQIGFHHPNIPFSRTLHK